MHRLIKKGSQILLRSHMSPSLGWISHYFRQKCHLGGRRIHCHWVLGLSWKIVAEFGLWPEACGQCRPTASAYCADEWKLKAIWCFVKGRDAFRSRKRLEYKGLRIITLKSLLGRLIPSFFFYTEMWGTTQRWTKYRNETSIWPDFGGSLWKQFTVAKETMFFMHSFAALRIKDRSSDRGCQKRSSGSRYDACGCWSTPLWPPSDICNAPARST